MPVHPAATRSGLTDCDCYYNMYSYYATNYSLGVVAGHVLHVLHAPGQAHGPEGEHDVGGGAVRDGLRRTESHGCNKWDGLDL